MVVSASAAADVADTGYANYNPAYSAYYVAGINPAIPINDYWDDTEDKENQTFRVYAVNVRGDVS